MSIVEYSGFRKKIPVAVLEIIDCQGNLADGNQKDRIVSESEAWVLSVRPLLLGGIYVFETLLCQLQYLLESWFLERSKERPCDIIISAIAIVTKV